MSKEERIFFSRLVTKNMSVLEGDRRLFKGYLTVEMVDKQNEITIRDELLKVVPVWLNRGGPISDNHSNRIVGRGLAYEKTDVYDEDTKRSYPAIMILAEIYKNYQLDDFIWEAIKTGEYKGLSFGGSTKTNRVPVIQENGQVAYALKDLEQYEVAVCKDPAVPLALIVEHNQIAKSMQSIAKYHSEGRSMIKCTTVGCYVVKEAGTKPLYLGRKDHKGKKVLYEGGKDSTVRDRPDTKKYQDTFDVYNDRDAIADAPTYHKIGGGRDGGQEWSATVGPNRPQHGRKVIEDSTDQQEPVITSGNQNDTTGNDQTYRGASSSKANTQGSYPSGGDSYFYKPIKTRTAIEAKAKALLILTILKADEGYHGDEQRLVVPEDDKKRPGRDSAINTSMDRDDKDEDDIKKVLPLLALAGRTVASTAISGGDSGEVQTSMDKDEKDLPIEKEDEDAKRNAEYDELVATASGKVRPSAVETDEGAGDLAAITGNTKLTLNPFVAERNKENTDPEDSKQKPGANALHDEYEGMLRGDVPKERMSTPGQMPKMGQIHPHLLEEGKSGDTFAHTGRIEGSKDHDNRKEKYDYSMNGIVKDPAELYIDPKEDKKLQDKSSDLPTGYVDKPKEERESRRTVVTKPMGKYANFEECLKDGNSEAYCGKIYQATHNKFNSAPSLQANNGEDGPHQPRTNNDETADGFVNTEHGNAQCTAPKDKSEIFLIGGTKGSFDTFQQGPGQSVQAREVPPKENDTNAREVEHKDSGKKDPYNSLNRAATDLLINLRATTILKQL